MTSTPCRLSVAANYDPALVAQLASYPVDEVYGKNDGDGFGSGRPRYMAGKLNWRRFEEYVGLLQQQGIAFNYLLNAACHANREWTRRWQRNLMRLLDRLSTMGIDRCTVVTPYLLERIKKSFPHFKVRVGIYAQIDTPSRARFWETLGADTLTLESFSINRDFPRLQAIRAASRCELQLIVNHPCLPNCPLQPYHQNGIAHASDGTRNIFIDYCFLRCTRLRLQDPTFFIRSNWIRPEDLSAYEAIGYHHFKLIERDIPSEEMLKRVRAYSEGRFEGNLAELLLPYGFGKTVRRRRGWWLRHFFRPTQVNPLRSRPFYELMRQQGFLFPRDRLPIRIDNAAIPADFLTTIRNHDCTTTDCGRCGHCDAVTDQAVRIDAAFRSESLARLDAIEKLLTEGALWHVE